MVRYKKKTFFSWNNNIIISVVDLILKYIHIGGSVLVVDGLKSEGMMEVYDEAFCYTYLLYSLLNNAIFTRFKFEREFLSYNFIFKLHFKYRSRFQIRLVSLLCLLLFESKMRT